MLLSRKFTEAAWSLQLETLAQVFSCEFCKIFINNFFTKHLSTTASESSNSAFHLGVWTGRCCFFISNDIYEFIKFDNWLIQKEKQAFLVRQIFLSLFLFISSFTYILAFTTVIIYYFTLFMIFDKFNNRQKFKTWLDYLLKSLRLTLSKQHVQITA